MKTTVKEFILDNMTDNNFKMLVEDLVINDARNLVWDMEYKVEDYLKKVRSNHIMSNTFEIINEIEKISDSYPVEYKENNVLKSDMNINSIIDKKLFYPQYNKEESIRYKVDSEQETDTLHLISSTEETVDLSKDNKEYTSFQQLRIEHYLSNIDEDYLLPIGDPDITDLNDSNYKELLYHLRNVKGYDLCKFLYEVLHFTSEDKMELGSKNSFKEEALIKIEYDGNNNFEDIYFLLDKRYAYASEDMWSKPIYGYYGSYDDSIEPMFVCYEYLYEMNKLSAPEYILAPFVNYLNEKIIIPKTSKENTYNILYHLMSILVGQGFTTEEQISYIRGSNDDYERESKETYFHYYEENNYRSEKKEYNDYDFTPDI